MTDNNNDNDNDHQIETRLRHADLPRVSITKVTFSNQSARTIMPDWEPAPSGCHIRYALEAAEIWKKEQEKRHEGDDDDNYIN